MSMSIAWNCERKRVVRIDEARDWHQWAELQREPLPAYKSRPNGQLWAGIAILAACAAFGYLFWTRI